MSSHSSTPPPPPSCLTACETLDPPQAARPCRPRQASPSARWSPARRPRCRPPWSTRPCPSSPWRGASCCWPGLPSWRPPASSAAASGRAVPRPPPRRSRCSRRRWPPRGGRPRRGRTGPPGTPCTAPTCDPASPARPPAHLRSYALPRARAEDPSPPTSGVQNGRSGPCPGLCSPSLRSCQRDSWGQEERTSWP